MRRVIIEGVVKEFTRGDSLDGNVGVFFAFRLIDIRKDDQSSLFGRNDDVSFSGGIIDARRRISFSFSLSRWINEPRVIYEIVFHPVTISFRRGTRSDSSFGRERWPGNVECLRRIMPTYAEPTILICCVDNGVNGTILSKPVYISLPKLTWTIWTIGK